MAFAFPVEPPRMLLGFPRNPHKTGGQDPVPLLVEFAVLALETSLTLVSGFFSWDLLSGSQKEVAMLAKEMSERDIREILARSSIGRLGCSRDDQPYVLPISFAYEPHHLYAFSTEGQKIEWMRTNPKVCLEVDEITDHSSWTSVVIFGRYRELPDLPQFRVERYHAKELLKARALWWEHAYASRGVKTIVEVFPLFYCIEISSVTGYRSVADRPPKPKPING